MSQQDTSYVVLRRETAERVHRLVSWMTATVSVAGPSWARHEQDLRLASAEVEDAMAETVDGAPEHVDINLKRPMMEASIACPGCRMYCSCVGYLPRELAIFECRFCRLRHFVGLGASPVIRSEKTDTGSVEAVA